MTDLVFQTGGDEPLRLIVVLHGVGSSARDMAPVGEALSDAIPNAQVVVMEGVEPFDGGGPGRQWFSVRSVTPDNRPQRVAMALPKLLDRIEERRIALGLPSTSVDLVGFSQGAIMALAAAASGYAASEIVAFAGRLAVPVLPASSASPRLLLTHGASDPVIPAREGEDAAQRLADAGFRATFVAEPGHGHAISARQLGDAITWLSCAADLPHVAHA